MSALAQNIQTDAAHPLDAEQTCFKYQGTDILGGEPTKQYIYATNEDHVIALSVKLGNAL